MPKVRFDSGARELAAGDYISARYDENGLYGLVTMLGGEWKTRVPLKCASKLPVRGEMELRLSGRQSIFVQGIPRFGVSRFFRLFITFCMVPLYTVSKIPKFLTLWATRWLSTYILSARFSMQLYG